MSRTLVLFLTIAIILSIVIILMECDRTYSFTDNYDPYSYYVENNSQCYLGAYNTCVRMAASSDSRQNGKSFLPLELFPERLILEQNWEIIAEDARRVCQTEIIPTFGEVHPVFSRISGDSWRTFILKWYSGPLTNCLEKCPRTCRLINSIPQIKAAMFSILAPNSEIPPHRGPYKGCIRYHLGLDIPSGDCYIEVDGTKYKWQNGRSMLFDDTYTHRVMNNTNQRRIILFIDILRPLPRPFGYINRKINENGKLLTFTNELNSAAEKSYSLK